jgi:hypothetical protein
MVSALAAEIQSLQSAGGTMSGGHGIISPDTILAQVILAFTTEICVQNPPEAVCPENMV